MVTSDCEIVYPVDVGIVGQTAQAKKMMNVPDVNEVHVMVRLYAMAYATAGSDPSRFMHRECKELCGTSSTAG